jgi:hypothetical protein
MSSLLSETARALGASADGDGPRTAVGVVAIVVLLALLVLREMARVEVSGPRARRVERLHFVTVPLICVFAAVVVPRIVELLT